MSGKVFVPLLEASLAEVRVVERGDYRYFVHPLCDGVPLLDPELLKEAVEALVQLADLDCDFILTAEAMGLPLGAALSIRTGLPLAVARKRAYGFEGELELGQTTGYSTNKLYLNCPGGRRALIIDDVLSTGGTLRALVGGLRSLGVEVAQALVVFAKSPIEAISAELDLPVEALLEVEFDSQGMLRAVDSINDKS